MAKLLHSGHAYAFKVQQLGPGHYRMSWVVDRQGNRIRYPTVYSRDTGVVGAFRFAKKHGLAKPNVTWPRS